MSTLLLASSLGRLNAVRTHIENGCDINERDRHGWTSLRYAVSYAHVDIVRELLSSGADPSIPDNKGFTVFDYIRNYTHWTPDNGYKLLVIEQLLSGYNENEIKEPECE